RDEEIEQMYRMIFEGRMLLVYGASGTGKTSLILCGLAGRFQTSDWLALNIRRGTNINTSLAQILETTAGGRAKIDKSDEFDSLLAAEKGVAIRKRSN